MNRERAFNGFLRAAAGLSIALMAGLVAMLVLRAWPALRHAGSGFLTSADWDPNQGQFGALAFVYGTVVSSVLALVIAVPLSVATALCLTDVLSKTDALKAVSRLVSFAVEMLAAIPSVVYGLWGVFVLAPLLREWVQPALAKYFGFLPLFSGPPLGIGMLSAGVILAIMITPTLTALAREIFKSIPRIQREAALALGATRSEMLWIAVLRSARSGLAGAVVLAWGRALGETMAVTMVIGNRPQISASLFAPAQTLASVLANEYAEASGDLHLSALSALGLVLLLVSVGVQLLSRLIVPARERDL